MAYELFDQKAARTGTPGLTISTDRFHFNADAGDLFAGTGFAHILWDRESRKVAVRPIQKSDVRAYTVTYYKGKRGASITAKAFLRHIQWTLKKPFSVPVAWNEKERLIEAQLPKEYIGSLDQVPKRKIKVI
jgi:hypothetical protein